MLETDFGSLTTFWFSTFATSSCRVVPLIRMAAVVLALVLFAVLLSYVMTCLMFLYSCSSHFFFTSKKLGYLHTHAVCLVGGRDPMHTHHISNSAILSKDAAKCFVYK